MTTEPKLPPIPDYPLDAQNWNTSECAALYAYGLQCFEAGRQHVIEQADALHGLAASSQEIEAAGHGLSDRIVKNGLVIDGTIDAAFNAALREREPDALRCILVELAHKSVDAAIAAASRKSILGLT